jgi:hypothetical protein
MSSFHSDSSPKRMEHGVLLLTQSRISISRILPHANNIRERQDSNSIGDHKAG